MLPDEFHTAVGKAAAAFAALEMTVAGILWGVAGVEQDEGRRVLPNSMRPMLAKLSSELDARVSDPALRKLVRAWMADVTAIWRKRNLLLHSAWGVYDGDRFMQANLRPYTIRPEDPEATISVAEILAIVDQASDLVRWRTKEFRRPLMEAAPGPWSVA